MRLRFILRSTWRLLVILPAIYLAGATLFWLCERGRPGGGPSFGDALYYGVVTLSTVGYGDVVPMTTGGRLVAVGMILFALTSLGYFITGVQEAVVEARRMAELGLDGTRFEGHLVIVGWTHIGRVALSELLAADRRVAVVCERAESLPELRTMGDPEHLFATAGSLDAEAVLERAGVRRAATVVVCTDDDTQNLILSLNVRAMSPTARIIVSVRREELRKTLLSASGVTYVASPFELSGRLVASAAFEPEVARFVEEVTSGAAGGYDLQQFMVTPTTPVAGRTAGEIGELLRQSRGPLLVAVGTARGGDWDLHPNPDGGLAVNVNDLLIVLGSKVQNQQAVELLGVTQGR